MYALAGIFGVLSGSRWSASHLGRRQHRAALHAALDRRRHPRRRRVRRRPGLAGRRGHRRDDADARRLVPLLPALPPDWQIGAQGAILIIGPGAARADRPRREGPMTACTRSRRASRPSPGSGPTSARSPSGSATVAFTGGQAGVGLLRRRFTFATFFTLVAHRPDVRHHPRARQRRPSIPATMTLAGTVAMKIDGRRRQR